ncbi:hypothetical protein [Bacillus suaedaesalsae]|uniref:Uncharacterized protein n=1 Tax=Bacillus suaedaesalsae TaxID=2810349 RepID=A0ABS2DPH4_9BACI|nr:hypothetical protein [Bacillus suaedaesalsae]MBM6619588.1 hypothetical protein [Bacillus suaedaesalsae]
MHWKKYLILLPPFLFIGILSIILLPVGEKHNSLLLALLFWVVYYLWIHFEKDNKN